MSVKEHCGVFVKAGVCACVRQMCVYKQWVEVEVNQCFVAVVEILSF